MASDFPIKAFDGSHCHRPNLGEERGPNYQDYLRLAEEIRAVQQFVIDLTGSKAVLPDLDSKIREGGRKVDDLFHKLSKITPPADLKKQLDAIKQQIEDVDQRTTIDSMAGVIDLMNTAISELSAELKSFKKEGLDEIRRTLNENRALFEKHVRETTAKQSDFEARIKRVEGLAHIQAIASRMQV